MLLVHLFLVALALAPRARLQRLALPLQQPKKRRASPAPLPFYVDVTFCVGKLLQSISLEITTVFLCILGENLCKENSIFIFLFFAVSQNF